MANQDKHQLGQYIPVHYHYQMLSDQNRMINFRNAINMKVKEDHHVVDLGSGTGALSFFASQSCHHVTGVENNKQLVNYSNELIKINKKADNIRIEYGDGSDWVSEDVVDIVICEMLHSALLREKQIQVINSFKSNHLDKFGTVPEFIPYATLLAVQPMLMNYDFQGFIAPVPLFQDPYTTDSSMDTIEPKVYKTVVYEDYEDGVIDANLKFVVDQKMSINALRFITKNILSMNRISKDSVEWFNQYLVIPIGRTLDLELGESFRVRFKYHSGDDIDVLQQSMTVTKLLDLI